MPQKETRIPLADFIKYGTILLSVGIQLGMFYDMKEVIKKHETKIEALEKEAARQNTEIEILHVRARGRR